MLPFAEEGDQDCKEAMFENLTVIGRINERIELLREEVERRGMPWVNGDGEEARGKEDTRVNGAEDGRNGSARNGRLTDEELRRQLEAQMGEEEEEDGVHL